MEEEDDDDRYARLDRVTSVAGKTPCIRDPTVYSSLQLSTEVQLKVCKINSCYSSACNNTQKTVGKCIRNWAFFPLTLDSFVRILSGGGLLLRAL